MLPEKMTPEQIAKVAEDVRTIERFQDESLNHGFDSGLISAKVLPVKTDAKISGKATPDWPLYAFIGLVAIFIALISPRYVTEISEKTEGLLLALSLLVGTLIVMVGHIKFKDKVVSTILSVGLFIVVAIGFGVLTPEEAIKEAKEMTK